MTFLSVSVFAGTSEKDIFEKNIPWEEIGLSPLQSQKSSESESEEEDHYSFDELEKEDYAGAVKKCSTCTNSELHKEKPFIKVVPSLKKDKETSTEALEQAWTKKSWKSIWKCDAAYSCWSRYLRH